MQEGKGPQCPSCGEPLADGFQFCPACGEGRDSLTPVAGASGGFFAVALGGVFFAVLGIVSSSITSVAFLSFKYSMATVYLGRTACWAVTGLLWGILGGKATLRTVWWAAFAGACLDSAIGATRGAMHSGQMSPEVAVGIGIVIGLVSAVIPAAAALCGGKLGCRLRSQ